MPYGYYGYTFNTERFPHLQGYDSALAYHTNTKPIAHHPKTRARFRDFVDIRRPLGDRKNYYDAIAKVGRTLYFCDSWTSYVTFGLSESTKSFSAKYLLDRMAPVKLTKRDGVERLTLNLNADFYRAANDERFVQAVTWPMGIRVTRHLDSKTPAVRIVGSDEPPVHIVGKTISLKKLIRWKHNRLPKLTLERREGETWRVVSGSYTTKPKDRRLRVYVNTRLKAEHRNKIKPLREWIGIMAPLAMHTEYEGHTRKQRVMGLDIATFVRDNKVKVTGFNYHAPAKTKRLYTVVSNTIGSDWAKLPVSVRRAAAFDVDHPLHMQVLNAVTLYCSENKHKYVLDKETNQYKSVYIYRLELSSETLTKFLNAFLGYYEVHEGYKNQ